MKPSLLVFAMAIFAIVGMGCSGDSPVAPVESSTVSPVNSTGETPTVGNVHIYGTVKDRFGEFLPNVIVLLKYRDSSGIYHQFARLTSDADGQFSYDWYTSEGTVIQCYVLGDAQFKTWQGGAYMYFGMTFRGGYKTPYEMDNP